MNNRRKINRRSFLHLSAMAAGGVVLAACGGNTNQANNATKTTSTTAASNTPQQANSQTPPTGISTPAQSTEGTGGGSTAVATQGTGGQMTAVATQGPASNLPVPKSFKEAPTLTKQSKAGKLPAVAERLPKQPMVLKPVERVGTYGGSWRQGLISSALSTALLVRSIGYENLVRWQPDTRNFRLEDVIPNVAASFKRSEDAKEYTFKLREGMKWSDGKPFTAYDIMFWYEDVLTNKDLTPAFPDWLITGDKPAVVEKTGDNTVVFRFTEPNALFLRKLATPAGDAPTSYPAHYMKQFHKKYNPDVVQQAKKANLDDWSSLFLNKASDWDNKEKPTLFAWKLTAGLGEATQQLTADRNPYYWKVDTEGNQLPYLDSVVYSLNQNSNVLLLKALNGEIDMQDRRINALSNKPLFFKNQKKGNFHLFDGIPIRNNTMMVSVNLTHRDATKRKVFSNKDFRIGLSYAINRQEIINVVQQGQGKPWQLAPHSDSPYHNERLATQYIEYSVEKANEHLDKVLPKKDSQGRRLGPDNKPFSFQMEMATAHSEDLGWADSAELIKRYWGAVGIDISVKVIADDLFSTRANGNELDSAISVVGAFDPILDPRTMIPTSGQDVYAVPWETWYNNPKSEDAIEPPAQVKKQMELYRRIWTTSDPQKQIDLMQQALDIAADQFYAMGISLPPTSFGIVKNDFHNVPKQMLIGYTYPEPAPTNPCQYFKESAK